jgi:hypothetical protein
MSKVYTYIKLREGFGAQYQKIIQTYIYCKIHKLDFVYSPLEDLEHNYDNDIEYVDKLENTMNLKINIINLNENIAAEQLDYGSIVMKYFEKNIDECCECEHMKFIKDCFWVNKNKDYFKNDKLNVAIHIRRDNLHDNGRAGERVTTPNSYYLNIMNIIREKYNDKDNQVLFHIYSQGDETKFIDLVNSDVKMYLNYDIIESFIGMVAADILVTSPSSLSYVAALISDGEIYYKKFWHNPRKNWIICG